MTRPTDDAPVSVWAVRAFALAGALWLLLGLGYAGAQMITFVMGDEGCPLDTHDSSSIGELVPAYLPPGARCLDPHDGTTFAEPGLGTAGVQLAIVGFPLVVWASTRRLRPATADAVRLDLLRGSLVGAALLTAGSAFTWWFGSGAGVVGLALAFVLAAIVVAVARRSGLLPALVGQPLPLRSRDRNVERDEVASSGADVRPMG